MSDELLKSIDVALRDLFPCDGPRRLGLKVLDADGSHIADAALLGGTDEILVRAAVAIVLAEHQATSAPGIVAPGAVQEPTQEVKMHTVAVTAPVALIEDVLHRQERLLADQRLVSSAVEFALVADNSGVVGVAKHLRQAAL